MAVSERTAKFLEKMLHFGEDPRQELGDLDTGFRHSTYYHKYFWGYTEIRKVSKSGRAYSERVYTAPWQLQQLTTRQWVLVKAGYVLGAVLSTVLFLWAMVRRVPTNSFKPVAVPGFLSGLLMVLLWMSVCTYVTAPRKMTLWQAYSGKSKIRRFTLLAAAGILATVLTKAVCICCLPETSWKAEAPGLLALFFSAVPPVLIYLTERKMPYTEEENANTVVDDERYEIL
ncbi:MAG: hypothetical protein ACI4PH_07010 [Faecousia sp.]